MRKIAWVLLILFVFAIPWEYSLDFGPPLGNVARILGLLVLLAAIPAVLQAGRVRNPGALQWLALGLYLWICCTFFWTIDPQATLTKMRSYPQEMLVLWLVWEFAGDAADLRWLLRAWLAGSWVLAILTLVNLASQAAAEQFRFAPAGQDPNDVARFLAMGFPIAALLYDVEKRRLGRVLVLGYFPVGLAGVLLTASRGGFVVTAAALAGGGILLVRKHARGVLVSALLLPLVGIAVWFLTPPETLQRLGTIVQQLQWGDMNQRLNIWAAGWRAFAQAPVFGHGAGSFVSAAGLAQDDTAHNTPLAILVESGLCGLFLMTAIAAAGVRTARSVNGSLRIGLETLLWVWGIASMVSTVAESRMTWLMLAVVALAGRLAQEAPEGAAECEPEFAQTALDSEITNGAAGAVG